MKDFFIKLLIYGSIGTAAFLLTTMSPKVGIGFVVAVTLYYFYANRKLKKNT